MTRNKSLEHSDTFADWETPPSLMSMFGVIAIDWAASEETTKAPVFVDKEEDTLSLTLEQIQAKVDSTDPTYQHYLNPPYGNMDVWIDFIELWQQAAGPRRSLYAVLPSNTDTKWFARAATIATKVILLTGRIRFRRNGVPGASPANGTSIFHFKQSRPRSPIITLMERPRC